ncbi:(Trans)glycosidase [Venustampulla echinocandica]|uniref:Endoglucanase EG-II n=1 Tax=Venustampulla echinocandica TaxID=2656787 RepID=A0A370T909_9HELO|nr:(Trans)glycosidase [Venustampulla echinocandica]RDL29985.1 (Trans)glycosidase [Venustampulla echinocandica]
MFLKCLILMGGAAVAVAKVQFIGMNIAGFEFGCQINGSCPISSATPPLSSLGTADGAGQMQHFVEDDQMNIFRLPVSWQYLVNNKLGDALDSTNFGKYDQLMQACLATDAYCAIDIHNFARFNGKIIGQSSGGPTDTQFADLWAQLAAKYRSNGKVIFGLMNEPHDVDITAWANTVQTAVTAIRNAGASTQMILLPGNNFTSAGTFVGNGSGTALVKVKNPDGTTTGLVLDVHKYLDVDNSGNHAECTTDNIADAFAIVAQFLRENGRQAIVSETGAGSTSSCYTDFCAQNTFLNQNSDVFLGYIAWAAGSFATSYTLSLTPSKQNGKLVDNALASQCVILPWLNAATAAITSAASFSTSTPVTTGVPGDNRSTTSYTKSASATMNTGADMNRLSATTAATAIATAKFSTAGSRTSSAVFSGSPVTTAQQVQPTNAANKAKIHGGLIASAAAAFAAAFLYQNNRVFEIARTIDWYSKYGNFISVW